MLLASLRFLIGLYILVLLSFQYFVYNFYLFLHIWKDNKIIIKSSKIILHFTAFMFQTQFMSIIQLLHRFFMLKKCNISMQNNWTAQCLTHIWLFPNCSNQIQILLSIFVQTHVYLIQKWG